MFGIGSTELLLILVVALIVLGPQKLVGVSKKLGRTVGEFRKVSYEFQRALNVETAKEELNNKTRGTSELSERDCPFDPSDNSSMSSHPSKNETKAATPENLTSLDAAVASAQREADNATQGISKENH